MVEAMATWASYAERGREALLAGDRATLHKLIDANFDLRTKLYQIGEGNLEMIERARRCGASANFAGSGGAIVGLYEGEEMFARLVAALAPAGIAVIKPQICA